jgi:hypothetical protein
VLVRAARAADGAGYRRHEFGDVQLLVRAPRRLGLAERQAAAANPGSNAA